MEGTRIGKIFFWIGAISSIITIIGYFGYPSYKSWFPIDNASKDKKSDTSKWYDPSKFEKFLPRDTIRYYDSAAKASLKNIKKIDTAVNSEMFKSLNLDSLKEAQDNNSNSAVISSKVTKILAIGKEESKFRNESAVHLINRPPEKGYGTLAIRQICTYCTSEYAYVEVGDERHTLSSVPLSQYDSSRFRETTYVQDFPIGNYKVVIDFNPNGKKSFDAVVKEGNVSLYKCNKKNPFGTGNGLVIFVSNVPKIKCTIEDSVYEISLVGITIDSKKGKN